MSVRILIFLLLMCSLNFLPLTANPADAHYGWCRWHAHCCAPCGFYRRSTYRPVRYGYPIPAWYFPVPRNYFRD